MTVWSTSELAFQVASTPSGIPISTAKLMVETVSAMVD
jgi:hypothetical protein